MWVLWVLLLSHQATLGIDIFVDREKGTDSHTCVTGGEDHPCADLGVALEGLTCYNHSTVRVAAGNYSLNNSGEDAAGHYQYLWMVGVAIVAIPDNRTMPVKVECQNDTGLVFIYSTNITIRGLVCMVQSITALAKTLLLMTPSFTCFMLLCTSCTHLTLPSSLSALLINPQRACAEGYSSR